MCEIKTNSLNKNLWCIYSKEKIEIGEDFIERTEEYGGEKIRKQYKLEYKDFIEEDNE